MKEMTEKYVAKALEGYEQNYKGVSDAITQVETQLETFKVQQAEMLEGITEMRGILGLSEEDSPAMSIVTDGDGDGDAD
tara:strand:+ start:650 stop:886 length:237 start_codon:yes stop_codon:yes gene_type:complete